MGSAAEEAFEPAFEEGAALGGDAEDVADFDAFAGVVADEMDGAGNVTIFNNEDVGALAGGDAGRWDEVGFAADDFAGHHGVEEGGGFVAGAVHVGDDAGEGRVGELAEEFVVIHAEDSDFIGDGNVQAAAGVEDLLADKIIAGKDANWPGELFNPAGEVFDDVLAVEIGGVGRVEDVAIEGGGADAVLKMFAAPFGPIEAGVAGVGEVFEAAFEKVIERQVSDSAVVGFEPRQGGNEARGADVDDGDGDGAECVGDALVFDARDDAVAVPMVEPGGGFVAAIVFGKVEGPGAMFADVGDDAASEAARVSVGGLDQEGDFDRRLHCGPC